MATDLSILQFYETQFGENFMHLSQQRENRLAGMVNMMTVVGKERSVPQIGKRKIRKITTRLGKTIASDSQFAKRWLRLSPFDDVYKEDEWDEALLGNLGSPKSEILQSMNMAFARGEEQIIIDALVGDAAIGEFGQDLVALPNSQKVAVNYVHGSTGANSGLTLAKLIKTRSIFGKNEVLDNGERPIFLYTQQQLDDLLHNVDQVSNDRYSDVKALVDGVVDHFMGFRFVRTEQLPIDAATGVRTCVAYVPSGVAFSSNARATKMAVLDTENEALQLRVKQRMGATRLEEEKVVVVYTDETP